MRKLFFTILYLSLAAVATVFVVTSTTASKSEKIEFTEFGENKGKQNRTPELTIKVVSFNTAHGAKEALSPVFSSKQQIKANLNEIAEILKNENADIIALQAVDGPSFWSQNFNHAKYIGYYSGFPYLAQSYHVNGVGLKFGTAILTQWKPTEAYAYTFSPSPPTFAKGFTVATLTLPGQLKLKAIDVISIHLDFALEKVQTEQLAELVEFTKTATRPYVIMGDFNLDWKNSRTKFAELQKITGVRTYKIEDNSMVTYPSKNVRYDWILVSKELEIRSQKIIKSLVSHHYAIAAELELAAN